MYAVEAKDGYQAFLSVSDSWHSILGVGKSTGPASITSSISNTPEQWSALQVKRLDRVSQLAVKEDALQTLTRHSGMTIRPHQRATIQAMFKKETDVISVAATGSGKSEIWMLVTKLNASGVTIVVPPLRALAADIKQRLERYNIDARIWTDEFSHEMVSNVIIVQPESIASEKWKTFADKLKGRRAVDLVVIDEAHLILSKNPDFRPSIDAIGHNTKSLSPRRLWLTVTLPHSELLNFKHSHGITDCNVVRQSTNRPNLRYRWIGISSPDDQLRKAMELVSPLQNMKNHKAIVYFRSLATLEQACAITRWPAYHGQLTKFQQETNIREWKNSTAGDGVIAATTALGLGVDIPEVVIVIVLGKPYSLIDLVQQFGRAGRNPNGQAADAILICGQPKFPISIFTDKECRRRALASYLDGEQRTECLPNEAKCDNCAIKMVQQMTEIPLLSTNPVDASMSSQTPRYPRVSPISSTAVPSISQSPTLQPLPNSTKRTRQEHDLEDARSPTRRPRGSGSQSRDALTTDFVGQYEADIAQKEAAEQYYATELGRLNQTLLALHNQEICPLCFILSRQKEHHHLDACQQPIASEVVQLNDDMVKWRKNTQRFPDFSCCYTCWAPQVLCRKRVDGDNCSFGRCLRDIITILFMFCCSEVRYAITQLSGENMCFKDSTQNPFGSVECDKWLVKKRKIGGFEATNMIVALAGLLNQKLNGCN